MLITDQEKLKKFSSPYRLWQGIPGIEVTKGGRIFSVFYSGGKTEEINNFVVVVKSDDGGKTFSEPVVGAFRENYRCFDACIWIDPLDRLWLIWALAPEQAVYGAICENPDADTLVWGEEFLIGYNVMMNKPIVLSTGEWLFPLAVWHKSRNGFCAGMSTDEPDDERKAFVYKTVDAGKTFIRCGGSDIPNRYFDEHMVVELNDGRLAMYVRTHYGIGVCHSFDRGKTWTRGGDSGLGGPCSRFHIARLKSGRLLLVNHYNFTGRSHMTAMLSEDEGKTWPHKLLLDERSNVSYPDAAQDKDGNIYITYDRERGTGATSFESLYLRAREILFAKITEEDIINGSLVTPGSKLKCIVSKLGKYIDESENLYQEPNRFTSEELTEHICDKSNEEVLAFIFDQYQVNCINMHLVENEQLDALVEQLNSTTDRKKTIREIICLIRSVVSLEKADVPIVESIKDLLQENLAEDLSLRDIASRMCISVYYMCHLFKKATGITIGEYKKELKLTKAKEFLVKTDMKITEISEKCGFGSDSYFSKVFMESEKLSPTQYRENVRKHQG